MSIRKRDVHFSDWTKVRHALVCNNVQGITETSSFDDVRAFLINSKSGLNPFYYYVCYIKETKEIYTHGQFYAYSKSSYDDTELRNLIGTKADLSALEALISEVEENEEVTAAALTELHENKADKSEIPDVSTFATKDELNTLSAEVEEKVDSATFTTLSETVAGHTTSITNLESNKADKTDLEDYAAIDDLNTKQDLLVSGTNIKTVNNNSILGSGNIETPDTKVTSADNHYGYDANNATSTTGAFVTKITKDAANHVTSFESRALISTDIPELDASKITSGEISIDRLPKGALERLFVVESEAAAISATVQEGDVVQVTGNNNKMYFCISNTETTFATKFKEFTAGTATSVPWSGITGKPTGIDGWGDRIGIIESGYATQSWVGDNYLSKNGGKIIGKGDYQWVQLRLSGNIPNIMFEQYEVEKGCVGWMTNIGLRFQNANGYGLAVKDSNEPIYYWGENGSVQRILLHAGNYSDYALSINGGTVNGTITANSFIGNLTGTADNAAKLDGKSLSQIIKFEYADNSDGVIDLNNSYSDFTYISSNWPYNGYANVSNSPWSASAASVWTLPGNYNLQIAKYYKSNDVRIRGRCYEGWTDWVSLIHSGNFSNYALPKDGIAASATKLATPRTIWGQSFDGTQDLNKSLIIGNTQSSLLDAWQEYIGICATGTGLSGWVAEFGNGTQGILLGCRGNNYDIPSIGTVSATDIAIAPDGGNVVIGGTTADEKLHVHGNGKFTGSITANSFIGSLTGNADSATKLQTPRTIWGQSFDGTGNVRGDLYVHQLKIELGNEINSYDYNFNTANGNVHLNFRSRGNVTLAKGGGNVAIGGTTADEKLHIYGNVKASGSMYAVDFATTSDNRLKDFVSDIYVDFESIKQIPKKYYYWKDKSMGEDLQLGTSAQELAKIYPECVHYDETNDRYSVNYQKLSIVALAAIDKLHDRVSELESKLYDKNN